MAPMKMDFDNKDSARTLCPEGEYGVRLGEKGKKLENSSKGKPMLTCHWSPFDPPDGVTMQDIEKADVLNWVSLAPNALFTLKNLCDAAGQQIECKSCNNVYDAKHDFCPQCNSSLFSVDLDFIDTCQVGALIEIVKDKNDRDVNNIKKFFRKYV